MNNTPAFPNPHLRDDSGMTLRDYFAAKAMQGLLSGTTINDGLAIVKNAYALADAMLKAREA